MRYNPPTLPELALLMTVTAIGAAAIAARFRATARCAPDGAYGPAPDWPATTTRDAAGPAAAGDLGETRPIDGLADAAVADRRTAGPGDLDATAEQPTVDQLVDRFEARGGREIRHNDDAWARGGMRRPERDADPAAAEARMVGPGHVIVEGTVTERGQLDGARIVGGPNIRGPVNIRGTIAAGWWGQPGTRRWGVTPAPPPDTPATPGEWDPRHGADGDDWPAIPG